MPERGIEIDAELVRALLRDQHPDLADHSLTFGARGWDNQLWRLGDDLAVRLPWATESADALLLKEHEWLPKLAPGLPLAVPVPLRLGRPSARFAQHWIVTTWVRGEPADHFPITSSASAAEALAAFLSALHQPAPSAAPSGRGRGGSLTPMASGMTKQLAALTETGLIPEPDAVQAIWDDAVAAPEWTGPPLWLHGDLHPANVLTEHGDLCGIIDFGDLCAGDPACDIASCWILLPNQDSIRRFRDAHPQASDAATWSRARGWAIWRAIGCLLVADAGKRGQAGGKPSWEPPALASVRHLLAESIR
jgi:aminoglycoside phosphotransferase (APT) family kinase protein